MAIVISSAGIDMGGNPVSNASQIDSVLMNENGVSVATDAEVSSAVAQLATKASATESAQGLIELATTAETQAGTDDTRAITPLKLKNSVLGLGQTWQDFTVGTQRIANTTYTNTTGKPIVVIVSSYGGTNNDMWVYLDSGVGFRIGIGNVNTGNAFCAGSVIIPSASTYKISATGALYTWTELR